MNNNPITEVGMFIIAGLLIIGGALLLYFGRIDFTAFALMFGSALALFGVNGALKAPSPAQQTQLNGQQQNLQYLLSQTLATLPGIIQSLQPQTPSPIAQFYNKNAALADNAPPIEPQPQQTAMPMQVQSPVSTPARGPVANPGAMQNQQPLQGSQQTLLPPYKITDNPAQQQPGQFLPAVNLGQGTAIQQPQVQFPQRSWNDSQIMPSVGPGQQGQ